jgi:hypothetical protein
LRLHPIKPFFGIDILHLCIMAASRAEWTLHLLVACS